MTNPTYPIHEAEIAIIGASLGGIAAALAALEAGRTVILSESTAWIGGQVTSQAVSALDEHIFIESIPGTRRYAAFRQAIRHHYQRQYNAPAAMPDGEPLNPGNGWVSRLCFEPRVGLRVLQDLLAPHLASGRLRLLTRHTPVACLGDPSHIRSVILRAANGHRVEIRAAYFLDATELGDLLPLAGLPYVSGAEAREDTGEIHASPDGPHPDRVQSFTTCFLVEFCPGQNHTIRQPNGYSQFRDTQPFTLTTLNSDGSTHFFPFFTPTAEHPLPFWTYRRVFDHFLLDPHGHRGDIALINWDSNDYRGGSLIDVTPSQRARAINQSHRLSLSFLFYLQTEVPREDGLGLGYPELRLLSEAVGTRSGSGPIPLHPRVSPHPQPAPNRRERHQR